MERHKMKSVWLLAQITFKEGVRNRILLGILFFAFALCVFNLAFTNMFSHELGKAAVDVGLSVVSIAGLIIIFFMGIIPQRCASRPRWRRSGA